MNRAARRHLLGLLADYPVVVGYVPPAPRLSHAAETFLRSLNRRGWFVLTAGNVMGLLVRTVAGKGGRRRGLRRPRLAFEVRWPDGAVATRRTHARAERLRRDNPNAHVVRVRPRRPS